MLATRTQLSVADLMTFGAIVVGEHDPVDHVKEVLREQCISGVPVVNEDGVLVGVFSQTDALHLEQPHIVEVIHHRTSPLRVGEVMSRPPVIVSSFASIEDAARLMVTNDVHRVVAVDDAGHPIGVLAAMDFVRLAAGI